MRRLRPFGAHCTVMKHHAAIDGQKSRLRSHKGIMCGYGYGDPFGQKGWRVYVPKLKRVLTSTNVLFFKSMQDSLNHRPTNLVSDHHPDIDLFQNSPHPDHAQPTDPADINATPGPTSTAPVTDYNTSTTADAYDPLGWTNNASHHYEHHLPSHSDLATNTYDNDTSENSADHDHHSDDSADERDTHQTHVRRAPPPVTIPDPATPEVRPAPPDPPRRSARLRRKRGTKYTTPSARDIKTGPRLASSKAKRDLNKLVRLMLTGTTTAPAHDCSTTHAYFSTMKRIDEHNAHAAIAQNPLAGDIALPESYDEAISGPHSRQWKRAIKSEVQSLKDKNVFKLVDRRSLPKNANVITAKWVLKSN